MNRLCLAHKIFGAMLPYELINFLLILSLVSMIKFDIYLRRVGVASRRQSSRIANNFHPSSSITRYRLAASGNNSAPKSPSRVKEKEKERESEIRPIFFPELRQENRVSRNRVLTNSDLNERKLSTALRWNYFFFGFTICSPMDKWIDSR